MSELVKRLRAENAPLDDPDLLDAAAGRIEALEAENARLRDTIHSYETRGRPLMLHDPEMKPRIEALKKRIAEDPEFRRSLLPDQTKAHQ